MASVPGHESRQLEEKSDYGEEINEVERAQVAKRWTRVMAKYGVEARGPTAQRPWIRVLNRLLGILPVPPECRTDTQYSKIFFIWFSMNFNILSFVYRLSCIGDLTSDA